MKEVYKVVPIKDIYAIYKNVEIYSTNEKLSQFISLQTIKTCVYLIFIEILSDTTL